MTSPQLDDTLLASYIQTFFGYGDFQAPFWLIGMEERGATTFEDIQQRLGAWHARGGRELEDVAEYHRALGVSSLFGPRPPLQPTWQRLIRIVLGAQGLPAPTERVRQYQAEQLGRPGGDTALLELLPLPAPGIRSWPYRAWSSLPYLESRDRYREHVAPQRAAHLQQALEAWRPPTVLFYGMDGRYRAWWERLAGVEMVRQEVEGHALYRGRTAHTLFLIIPHPVAHGLSHRFFEGIGQLIAQEKLP